MSLVFIHLSDKVQEQITFFRTFLKEMLNIFANIEYNIIRFI